MKFIKFKVRDIAVGLSALAIGLVAVSAYGQDKAAKAEKADKAEIKTIARENRGFCNNNNWSGDDRVSFNELREMTVSGGGTIAVDGGPNGGIAVKGEDRSDVAVRACVQTWGHSAEEARAIASSIRIGTAGAIKADGPETKDMGWSVSYQLLVPRSSNLKLTAHNGGISINNVDGAAEFETMNGGVSLMNVSGDFRGKTTNGGVNVSLSGASWKGSGLDVTTSNGGVNISLPENYAAHVETGTVNGGFSSDIPALAAAGRDENGRRRPGAKVSQDINGGGAPIKVVTTNGGVRINSTTEKD